MKYGLALRIRSVWRNLFRSRVWLVTSGLPTGIIFRKNLTALASEVFLPRCRLRPGATRQQTGTCDAVRWEVEIECRCRNRKLRVREDLCGPSGKICDPMRTFRRLEEVSKRHRSREIILKCALSKLDLQCEFGSIRRAVDFFLTENPNEAQVLLWRNSSFRYTFYSQVVIGPAPRMLIGPAHMPNCWKPIVFLDWNILFRNFHRDINYSRKKTLSTNIRLLAIRKLKSDGFQDFRQDKNVR